MEDARGEATITSYYAPYHGHDVRHLGIALRKLREKHDSVVFFAGDSSLDNKFWFDEWSAARNGYEEVLRPQVMKKDVCYWMNDPNFEPRRACLNAAVEATALDEPGRRSIRQNLQQRIRELELLLMERHRQLDMAEVHIRQLERRLEDAGLPAD